MIIVIDMDNTIVDEFGSTLRPGIIDFLEKTTKRNSFILWTNSKKERAYEIIVHHKLRKYFTKIIVREDYDPNDEGKMKDIRLENADVIIDDDPKEIEFNKKNRKRTYLVKSYRKNSSMLSNEFEKIAKDLC
jgi:hypothetical protein